MDQTKLETKLKVRDERTTIPEYGDIVSITPSPFAVETLSRAML